MNRSLICMTASVILIPAMPGPGRSQARASRGIRLILFDTIAA